MPICTVLEDKSSTVLKPELVSDLKGNVGDSGALVDLDGDEGGLTVADIEVMALSTVDRLTLGETLL